MVCNYLLHYIHTFLSMSTFGVCENFVAEVATIFIFNYDDDLNISFTVEHANATPRGG